LQASDSVVAAVVDGDFHTGFPAHLVGRIVDHGLFE
jgi:hypothetical protein